MAQQPPKPTKPKKPLGKPINWSDQALTDLSQISQADLEAADALWESEAPKSLKTLLQAEVIEENNG